MEWFNPCDKEHYLAFRHLWLTGTWPKDFYEKHAEELDIWSPVKAQERITLFYFKGLLVNSELIK